MARLSPLLALAALALGGCATEFEGEKPSSLYGQPTDAAVALYGPWDEALTLEGRRYYLWRRSIETEDGVRFCELRLEITSRNLIARRLMQGYPGACELFMARFVPAKNS
ncbi:hypothetical protein ACO2Q0_00125 [Phenylobacterium sp. VNQ135]|uniref:hypothetical protein n=1 Tax=Phenylobacterium sp. VNQ135 TaxID=3400922 RepID=UPI003BFCA5C4